VNAAHQELLRRRESLLLRSAALRQDWSLQVQGLRRPLGLADKAREAGQWLVRNPQWPIGAALLIVLLRPGRALRWASYGLQGYGLYRRVQRGLQRMPRSVG
jgi:hypothetical protein